MSRHAFLHGDIKARLSAGLTQFWPMPPPSAKVRIRHRTCTRILRVDDRSTPLISIVIPTYNRAPQLKELLESILREADLRYEVIVVDDGSTDCTEELLGSFVATAPDRLRVISQSNQGATAARNAGLAAATGIYTVFLDSDDLPERLWLSQITERVATGVDMVTLGAWIDRGSTREVRLPSARPDAPHRGLIWLAGCLVVRTELLRDVGGYRVDLPALQNEDLLTRVLVSQSRRGLEPTIEYVAEPLLHYRRGHVAGSISADQARRRQAIEAFLCSPEHQELYGKQWSSQSALLLRQASHLATVEGNRRAAVRLAAEGLRRAPSLAGSRSLLKTFTPRWLTALPARVRGSRRACRDAIGRRLPGRYAILCWLLRRRARNVSPRAARLLWADSRAPTHFYLDTAGHLIEKDSFAAVLECGSGLTTLMLARAASDKDLNYVSLEHSREQCEFVNSLLGSAAIDQRVTHAPLRAYGAYSWYLRTRWAISQGPLLVLFGCSPSTIPSNRDGLLHELQRRGLLIAGTVVLLGDIQYPSEWRTVERWRADFPALRLELVEDRRDGILAVLRVGLSGAADVTEYRPES